MAAKVFAGPSKVKEPEFVMTNGRFDREATDAEDARYLKELREWLEGNGFVGKYVGGVFSLPFADGSADYMVMSLRPLQLVHLNWHDAWNADKITMRGIIAADVKERIDADLRLKALFAERTDA